MHDIETLRNETKRIERAYAFDRAGTFDSLLSHIRNLQAALDQKHDDRLDDLATLVRRLVHEVRKGSQDNKLANNAMDYLARKDLLPGALRSEDE